MPKQNKLRGDWADILPQESTKTNKAKIEPSPWRCRYCKSALVRACSFFKYAILSHNTMTRGSYWLNSFFSFPDFGTLGSLSEGFPLKIMIKGIVWGFSARTVSWNVQNRLAKSDFWVLMCTLFVPLKSTVFFTIRSWHGTWSDDQRFLGIIFP